MAGIQFLLRILYGSFRTDGIYDRAADFNVVELICPMRLMLAGDSRVAQDDRGNYRVCYWRTIPKRCAAGLIVSHPVGDGTVRASISARQRSPGGLIFGLVRLRSPMLIGVRTNAAMEVAAVNGI